MKFQYLFLSTIMKWLPSEIKYQIRWTLGLPSLVIFRFCRCKKKIQSKCVAYGILQFLRLSYVFLWKSRRQKKKKKSVDTKLKRICKLYKGRQMKEVKHILKRSLILSKICWAWGQIIVCPLPRKLLWIAALLEYLQQYFVHFNFKKEIGFEYIRWINWKYCYCFNFSIYCPVSLRGKELNRECSIEFLINKSNHPFNLHCSIVSGPCLLARGKFFSVLPLPKMVE